jgi:K+-transporting ATPase KdpF subunit
LRWIDFSLPGKGNRNDYGSCLYRHIGIVFPADLAAAKIVRTIGRKIMNWLYLISAIIAVGLLVYLFVALLKPEMFE